MDFTIIALILTGLLAVSLGVFCARWRAAAAARVGELELAHLFFWQNNET